MDHESPAKLTFLGTELEEVHDAGSNREEPLNGCWGCFDVGLNCHNAMLLPLGFRSSRTNSRTNSSWSVLTKLSI